MLCTLCDCKQIRKTHADLALKATLYANFKLDIVHFNSLFLINVQSISKTG